MTNTTTTARPWYDTTWLVILLCIFIFPVGLYALWKSEKLAKGWKIAGTALIAVFIIVLFSETSEAKSGINPPVTLTPATLSSADERAEKQLYLFSSPGDFKNAFNKYAASNKLDLHIGDLQVQEGEVQNTFTFMFNEHLGILGSVNKMDGSVNEVTMLGTGDGTFKSGSNIILCMIAVIATIDPDLAPEKRIDVLKDLGLVGNKDVDIMNLSDKAERNGISYFISSSTVTGLIFGASRK